MKSAESVDVRRVSMPLVLAVTVLVAGASAWGVAQVARAKLDDTVSDVAALKARIEPEAAWHQHVEDRLDDQKAALDRIERKLGTDR